LISVFARQDDDGYKSQARVLKPFLGKRNGGENESDKAGSPAGRASEKKNHSRGGDGRAKLPEEKIQG